MRILTFDIEDWFHVLDNEASRGPTQWAAYTPRLHANMDRMLGILAEKGVKGTFFCLGWIAERHPEVIKNIHAAGHEIAAHSYAHQLTYEQSPEEFAKDLRRCLSVLEDLIGEKLRAYRAPGFSLTEENTWVFDILVKNGIEVDCSVFPAARGHGGFNNFGACEPALIECASGRLKAFPISVWNFLGRRLVYSGGGYFRLFPYAIIKTLVRRSDYVMTYFHPRDFDPGQPMLEGLGPVRRFKSYYGLARSEEKFRRLLDDFELIDLRSAERLVDWENCKRIKIS
jgi:polysaccharide deacetylase family protein (PEP-CTERM system associated)